MKKLIFIMMIFLIGCSNKTSIEPKPIVKKDEKLEIKDNLTFEYAEKISLYDLFKNSELIINENKLLDTDSLGNKKIEVNYKSNDENKKITIEYKVSDTTIPFLNVSNLTTKVGNKINFLNKLTCGDNYDREVKCEIIGDYDFNKVGTYDLKLKATDSSGNENEKNFKLYVVEKSGSSTSKPKYYFDDLIKNHKTDKTMVGIDVSVWQGNINFEKVKNAGCEFVMIRIGYGYDKNKQIVFDTKFKNNLINAKKAGLKVGLYFYSYAKSNKEAIEQAKWVIKALDGETLDLPIAFDWEIWNGFSNYHINFKDLNDIATSFINEINNAGYEGVIYSSAIFLNKVWALDSRTWLAYYTTNNDFEKDYFMWQLSSRGRIDGINGDVDLDVLYLDKKTSQ